MKQYHVAKPGESPHGPYAEAMIKHAHERGLYPAGTLIWTEDIIEWQPIEKIFGRSSSTPPPLPAGHCPSSSAQKKDCQTSPASYNQTRTAPNVPIRPVPPQKPKLPKHVAEQLAASHSSKTISAAQPDTIANTSVIASIPEASSLYQEAEAPAVDATDNIEHTETPEGTEGEAGED